MTAMAPLLQYGLTGLAAILAFLSYRLLLKESEVKSPRKTMLGAIKSFAILSIMLAVVSAGSSAFDTFFGGAQNEDVAELKAKLIEAEGKIARLNSMGTSQDQISELNKQLSAAHEEIQLLKTTSASSAELTSLRSQLAEEKRKSDANTRAAEAESQVNSRLIAERLLSDLPTARSAGKIAGIGSVSVESTVKDEAEARFRLVQRAIFKHVADFNGDAEMLSRSLALLEKQGRIEVQGNVERLVQELPVLIKLRLVWLRDEAIPALEKDIEFLKSRPQEQRDPGASVKIPESLWLFRHPSGQEPKEAVSDLAKLNAELNLLKNIP